jgi:hypothetical protein
MSYILDAVQRRVDAAQGLKTFYEGPGPLSYENPPCIWVIQQLGMNEHPKSLYLLRRYITPRSIGERVLA